MGYVSLFSNFFSQNFGVLLAPRGGPAVHVEAGVGQDRWDVVVVVVVFFFGGRERATTHFTLCSRSTHYILEELVAAFAP